jgi:hypothetical protein
MYMYSLEDDSNSHLLTEQWVSPHFISLRKRERERERERRGDTYM